MGYRVLITEAVNEKGLNYLREQGYELVMGTGPEEETLLKECRDCDGALTRNGKFTRKVFENCPKLKVVSMHGVGVDGIDVDAATEMGIQICNAAESNQQSVAEYAIGLILMLAKHSVAYNKGLKTGDMSVRQMYGSDVSGKTLGIIGMGNIGTKVARMAANDRQQRRYSGLRARLSRAAPEQEENHVSAQTTAEPALPTPMPLL